MMPRMDPRTQLKCDRGEWGYRYRPSRGVWGGGSFSVGPLRFASFRSAATIAQKCVPRYTKFKKLGDSPRVFYRWVNPPVVVEKRSKYTCWAENSLDWPTLALIGPNRKLPKKMLERTEMVVHGQRLLPGILGLTSPWTVPGVKLDIFAQQIGHSGNRVAKTIRCSH
jgi:hypothetical protein